MMTSIFGLGAVKPGVPAAAKADTTKQPAADKQRMRPYAYFMPISAIHADPERFQNREADYSEATVARLLARFDANLLDPIVVWRDRKDRKVYVLSGHSRLEAHRRAGWKEIPCRFFDGTEAEAINFAKVLANRATTAETLREDIAAFRMMRDGDSRRGIKPQDDKALKGQWGQQYSKLSAYVHLNKNGLFLEALSGEQRDQFPRIGTKAQWAGQLRRRFPQLTNLHEDELFRFLLMDENGAKIERADLEEMMESRATNPEFNPNVPLKLEDCKTCFQTKRKDTDRSQKELCALQDIQRMLSKKEFKEFAEAATPETRADISRYAAMIDGEIKRLQGDIEKIVKTQNSLFGLWQ